MTTPGPAVILIGNGGHAKVVLGILALNGVSVAGVVGPAGSGGIDGWPLLGDDDDLPVVEGFPSARPLRVLLYSWPFWPSVGGLERLTELTARFLVHSGHHVTVVTATPDSAESAAFPFIVERRPGLIRLVRMIRHSDIVQMNTFSAVIAVLAMLARRPIVWQHIDYDTISPRGICAWGGRPCDGSLRRCHACLRRDHSRLGTWRAVTSLLLKRLSRHVVAANAVSTSYAQSRMRLPRAIYLPFGIETTAVEPSRRPAPPPLRVLFFGRHIPAKGCDVLVRSVRLCRDREIPIQVRIAGDGPHRPVSEALATQLDLGEVVTFLGRLQQRELDAELARAHVVVQASTQDEIGALVLWEAMGAGCAVVASEIGALPEHVGDGGLFFPAGDSSALADRLERLAYAPELAEEVGRRGRELVRSTYDWEQMGRRYGRLYRAVLERRLPWSRS
jgi:glycosyltransferase involved in cell wall biosynthesis